MGVPATGSGSGIGGACDRLRRRKRWLSLPKPTRALPSTSSGSDGACRCCLRQAQAAGALAELAEANTAPSACDRLRRRKRWLSLPKPTRALPSTSSGGGGAAFDKLRQRWGCIRQAQAAMGVLGAAFDKLRQRWGRWLSLPKPTPPHRPSTSSGSGGRWLRQAQPTPPHRPSTSSVGENVG